MKNGTMIVGTEPIDETKRSCLRVEPVVKTKHRYPIVHPLHPRSLSKMVEAAQPVADAKRAQDIRNTLPNPAMKNCFQTQFFTCTLRKIELCGQTLNQFHVDEGAQFLLMHLTVHNMTNEILSINQ